MAHGHLAWPGVVRWAADGRVLVNIDYDKVGNRTHIGIHLQQDGPGQVAENSKRYYQYDAMNRQTVVDATDEAGTIVDGQGHLLSYDQAGNRKSDTHIGKRLVNTGSAEAPNWTPQDGETTETYDYDALNRLTVTQRDGTVVDTRAYDAANRVIVSGRGGLDDGYVAQHLAQQAATGLDPIQVRQNQYDANGRLALQKNVEYISPLASATGLGFTAVNYTYDAAGNVLSTVSADAIGNTLTDTAYTVGRAEGYRQAKTLSGPHAPGGPTTSIGGLFYDYDANGHLVHTGDGAQMIATEREHHFVNDVNGTVLYSYYDDLREPGRQVYAQRQLVVNGEVLGRYGMAADARFPIGVPGFPGSTVFSPQSDFSFGYQPINGRYPAGSPGTYAVLANDTLQGIAKGAYGDASLWYLIAEANGLSSSADLRAGQVLTIPTAVNGANNVDTFRPYDPSRISSDSPAMMAMPQGEDGGCGTAGQIIMVVIAVAVAWVTAGAAATALSQLGGAFAATGTATVGGVTGLSMTTAVTAGAIGGAVGSIASQAVGVTIGAQDSFSWKGVALAAVSGGVASGLSGWSPLGSEATVGNAIIRSAVGNSMTQGIAVATGLQDKFSWISVAASAVGAGVGSAISQALGPQYLPADLAGPPAPGVFDGLGQFGERLARGSVAGFAGGLTTAAMRGGRVSVTQVAVDAFGNALGDSLAGAMGQTSASQQTQGVGPWSDANYRNGMDIESDRVSDFNAFASAFTQKYERFDGVDVAGPGGSDIIRKAGASQALKDLTVQAYDGLTDVRAALSMGGQDAQRIAELRASGLQKLDEVRGSLQSSAELAQEVMGRGLTTDSDIQTLGMLGAFGDSSTVHRIAVAVSQAGGAGRATAQGIASQLSAYDGFDAGYMSRIPGDVSIERAAPAVYLNTLLDARSHVDTTMVYLSSMNDGQFAQLGSYVDTVIGSGGLSSYKQNEALAGAWMGLQGSPAAMGRIGEGVSIAGLGLRNVASGLGESLGRMAMGEGMFANSTLGRVLFSGTKPMYMVPNDGPQLPPWGGPVSYGNLADSPSVGPGKNFTQTQKSKIYGQNIEANGGLLRSDLDGEVLILPSKSLAGVTPSSSEAQIDHIWARKPANPAMPSGSNSYGNASVLSRPQNRAKSNN